MGKDSSLPLILIGGAILVGAFIYLKIKGELDALSNNNPAGAPTLMGILNKYQQYKSTGVAN